jgi:hypothetical protein
VAGWGMPRRQEASRLVADTPLRHPVAECESTNRLDADGPIAGI